MNLFNLFKPINDIDLIDKLSIKSTMFYDQNIGVTIQGPTKGEIYLLNTVLGIKCLVEIKKLQFTQGEISKVIYNIQGYLKSLNIFLDEQYASLFYMERLDMFYQEYKNYILALKRSQSEFPYYTFQTILDIPLKFHSNGKFESDLVLPANEDPHNMLAFIQAYAKHTSWLIRELKKH